MKGDKGKAPSVQWYYKDWLSDRKLQRAHPSSRGIWMNLLMHLIDCSLSGDTCKNGTLEDVTITELMQLGSCDENAAWLFLDDALKHQFCNVELDKNRTFHIMSRRLSRDAEKREYWRDFKRLQREKEGEKKECPVDVLAMSPPSPIPTPTPTANINKYITPFLGEFKNIRITEKQMVKLENNFGIISTNDRIETLSEYLASKGIKYKSHYATILAWDRRDKKNNPQSIINTPKPLTMEDVMSGTLERNG